MPFKDISYLQLWRPFRSAQQNHLCNFCRGYQEKQFCQIILNLDQWFNRRCTLKIFLIWSFCGPFIQPSVTICAILVEGIKMNNSVKLFGIWTSASAGVSFKDISYLELLRLFCSAEQNYLCNSGRGHYEEQFCEFISNLGH